MTTPARLPQNLEIGGVVFCQAWRDEKNFAIYQNYRHYTDDGLRAAGPDSAYHLFEIIKIEGAESLGQKIGTFSDLNSAIARAARTP